MNEEAAGYVWVDVYLLLEKVKFNNFNVSITDKGITLDMLLSEFEDLDSYSLPDLYAGARRDVERYVDALKEPGCAHFNTKLYYKFDITEDAEPNYYDDFECDFFSWINPQNDTLIEETKIGDYLLTIYFLKPIYGWTTTQLMMIITMEILTNRQRPISAWTTGIQTTNGSKAAIKM